MMKQKILTQVWAMFLICIATYSCKQSRENAETTDNASTTLSIEQIADFIPVKYSEIFDSVKFVKLETTQASMIGSIDKIIVHDDRIFVMDMLIGKKVYMFDMNGRFIKQVGSNGMGPGEYNEPNDFTINPLNNDIMVYSSHKMCMIVYKANGDFKKEIKLPKLMQSFCVLDSNLYLVYYNHGWRYNHPNTPYNMDYINENGEIVKSAFKVDFKKGMSTGGFSFFNKYTSNETEISPAFSNKIYTVSKDTIRLKYDFDFGSNAIPLDFIESEHERGKMLEYAYLVDFIETDDYLMFGFQFKRSKYTCFYSKTSKKIKIGNMFFNDLYGILSGIDIRAVDDNGWFVSNSDSESSDFYKNIFTVNAEDNLKSTILHNIENGVDVMYTSVLKELISSNSYLPSQQDLDFLNSIKIDDNPILTFYKLKDF